MRELDFCGAIREAMQQEMERDPAVFVYGIGVPTNDRIFGSTMGLQEQFGNDRVFDTPLSEDAMTGFGLGAAINGLRPVHVHIRVDFLILAMNQIVNMLSTYNYSTGGRMKVPMVIRAIVGRGWGQGYQHSKSLHSTFAHIPGLKVILPTTPNDAKGLLTAAIREDNPVLMLEHRWLYWGVEDVPEAPFVTPIGKSSVLRQGKDITVVATSWMNIEALKAAEILQREGVSVEIIDPRTVAPFDDTLAIESTRKTGHCIVADNDWIDCGFGAEVAARVSEKCFGELKSPVQRIGFASTPCPVEIIRMVEQKLNLKPIDLTNEDFYSHERRFKGPF